MDDNEVGNVLGSMLIDAMGSAKEAQIGNTYLTLAVITLLVDKNVITASEGIERLTLFRDEWLADQGPKAKAPFEIAIHVLKNRVAQASPSRKGWEPTIVQGGLERPD